MEVSGTEFIREHREGELLISTRKSLLDLAFVHRFLSEESYWAPGVPFEVVRRSVENSIAIGLYVNNKQVGFARLVTDMATFAYLADVFVIEAFRGQALSKKMMAFIFSWKELEGLRRIILATRDAHSLYARYGFAPLAKPDRFMEIARPDIYRN